MVAPRSLRVLLALSCTAALVALLAPSALGAVPTARITGVNCETGVARAMLTNTGGAPQPYTVLVDDVVVHRSTLPASPTAVEQPVPVARGARAVVTVRYGASYVSGEVINTCTADPVRAATVSPTPATAPSEPSVAALDRIDASSPVVPTWAVVAALLAALLAGTAFVFRIRRLARRQGRPVARRLW